MGEFRSAASGAAREETELDFNVFAILAVDLRKVGAAGLGAMTAEAGGDVPRRNTVVRDCFATGEEIGGQRGGIEGAGAAGASRA